MDTALVMSVFLNISFASCKDLMLTKMVLICKYEWMPLVCPCLLVCFILYRGGSFHYLEYISLGIVAFLEWKNNYFCLGLILLLLWETENQECDALFTLL